MKTLRALLPSFTARKKEHNLLKNIETFEIDSLGSIFKKEKYCTTTV